LTQEFEVLTKPIDVHMIREKLAMFLVTQVINKKGEFYHPNQPSVMCVSINMGPLM
jgi:hypothetical protein